MNCKPGDLAIVTYTPNGECVGSVVKIKEGWGLYDDFGYLWTVEHMHPVRCTRDGIFSGMKTISQCPDKWLKPVSGLPIDDEVTDDVKEPA